MKSYAIVHYFNFILNSYKNLWLIWNNLQSVDFTFRNEFVAKVYLITIKSGTASTVYLMRIGTIIGILHPIWMLINWMYNYNLLYVKGISIVSMLTLNITYT